MTPCKRSSILSSADLIENDDLLMEILVRLPAKSIIRFKLVSKHWKMLISDESFSREHTLRHRRRHPEPQPSLFLCDTSSSQIFIFNTAVKKLIPFNFRFPFVKILQSCNGLLLLECKNSRYGHSDYYVCNPTRMQFRNLLLRKSFDELFLAFDPSESPHYQVFLFRGRCPVLLYDSETHTWKETREFQLDQYKSCDGIICWKDCHCFIRSGSSTFYLFQHGVISRVRTSDIAPRVKKRYMMNSNGIMYCIFIPLRSNCKLLKVGDCIDGLSSCYLTYVVNLKPIADTFSGENSTAIDVLGMNIEEREEDSTILFHVPGKIIAYRFFDKCFEELIDFSGTRLRFGFKGSHPFIASLVSV